MLLGKEFESPGFVGLYPGHFQDNLGETGDLRIVRLRHLSQANHILFGDVSFRAWGPRNFMKMAPS
jgi:hypothetical protein